MLKQLSPNPDLAQIKKQAKEPKQSHRVQGRESIARFKASHPKYSKLSEPETAVKPTKSLRINSLRRFLYLIIYVKKKIDCPFVGRVVSYRKSP